MRSSLIILVAVAAFTVTAAGVLADDFAPPWWRGGDRSTWQQWEFKSDDDGSGYPTGLLPDPYTNPLFDPDHPGEAPLGAFVSGSDWTSGPEASGIWDLSGNGLITILIPNYSPLPPDYLRGPEKQIRIQLTWMPQDPQDTGDVPNFDAWGAVVQEPLPLSFQASLEWVHDSDAGSGWIHTIALLMFQPNPDFEMIYIKGDILVDEVVVDTICPEPATMVLLGLAVPFVLKRRSRS